SVTGSGLVNINLNSGYLYGSASGSIPVGISGFSRVEYQGSDPISFTSHTNGHFGGDTLIGGTGNDFMYGAANVGNGFYDGNGSDNSLSAGSGGDTLIGGLGADSLVAGSGSASDVFVYQSSTDSFSASAGLSDPHMDLLLNFHDSGPGISVIDVQAVSGTTYI